MSVYNTITMNPERPARVELDRGLVVAYGATFIPRDDLYPLQLEDGSYIVIKRTLHPDLIAAHLKGLITIGAYALDPESQAQWLCCDADDAETWAGVQDMARALTEQDIPAYLELSRRGGHLWLFTPPLPGVDARRLGRQLLAEHKLEGIELYPKQDALRTGPGAFVRLPLGRHRLSGRRYHFVTLAGQPLAPSVREQVKLLSRPDRVPGAFIDAVLSRAPPARPVSPSRPFAPQVEQAKRGRRKKKRQGTLSERLKAQVSVYDFVSQYVALNADGRGHCPFHDDAHKSFSVHKELNFWVCFAGCGGGSLIDFAMKWREAHGEDGSFTATVTALAGMLLN